MKRLLYYTYLSLALPLLLACQKDSVEPNGQIIETYSDTLEAKACPSYSFYTKFGDVNLGSALGDAVLVGFASDFPAAKRQQLLAKYKDFLYMEDETFAAYTPLNVVHLKPGSTCTDAEKIMAKLKKHEEVLFANPTVNDPDGILLWWGITNEFLVFFEGEASVPQFEDLARRTNTRILEKNDWGGLYYYIMSAEKNSAGDAVAMCSMFNKEPYVLEAVPNYFWQQRPTETTPVNPVLTTHAEQMKHKFKEAAKEKKNNK